MCSLLDGHGGPHEAQFNQRDRVRFSKEQAEIIGEEAEVDVTEQDLIDSGMPRELMLRIMEGNFNVETEEP